MKRQIGMMVLMSISSLRADVEVFSEQGSKPSKNAGIIEVRNDTKDDFGVAVVIPNKGRALFAESKALTKDSVQGRLKAKDYLRITELVGAGTPESRGLRTALPLDVSGEYKIQIYDPKTKSSVNYRVSDNKNRKVIALVVEKDKDGMISARPQKGNKAKALFAGSGSSSGIHLNANVLDEDIKKQ